MEPIEEEEEPTEPLREAVDEKVRKYVSERYFTGSSGAFLTEQEDGTGAIAVCINSTLTKPASFWFDPFLFFSYYYLPRGGRWKSAWIVILEGEKCPIKASVDVEVHFYEAGNVAFKCHREFEASVTLGV